MTKTYSELITLDTFAERMEYLLLFGEVSNNTYGVSRIENQLFYRSPEWRRCRNKVIIRDHGCDLGVFSHEIISGRVHVHHINPITRKMIEMNNPLILDPNNLITCSNITHNKIHYGNMNEKQESLFCLERTPGDTTLWTQVY